MQTIQLEPVDSVTITRLIDNSSDLLLADKGPAKRPALVGGKVPLLAAPTLEGGQGYDSLRAGDGVWVLGGGAKA